MTNHPELLKLAFDWYVASYYLTKRQRQAGRRISLGKVVCIHYETSWEGQSRKSDNFFVMGEEPETVVESIKRYGPAEDHRLYVIADRPSLTISYMGLDCSAMTPAGTLMARNLENLPMTTNDLELFRPESPGDVLMLNTIEGADLTLAEDVVDPRLDFFYAMDGNKPAAMARFARGYSGVGWVSHVYTAPESRRKGLATSMMIQVLADRHRQGDQISLLLATHQAHNLYRRLGYSDVATVLNFVLT